MVSPKKQGLYDPAFEKDSCGVGFVMNMKGEKSHEIIRQGIEILNKLEHRGACGSDSLTGDGAGLLFQVPHKFFKTQCSKIDIELPERGKYGTGLVFFPKDVRIHSFLDVFNKVIKQEGLSLLGWRKLPVDNTTIGQVAREAEPEIWQPFIGQGDEPIEQEELERRLYKVRKHVGREIHFAGDAEYFVSFYICSLSTKTICYKGQLMSSQLETYFLDLKDPELESALALAHSRYSTNTFPSWGRAQPMRLIAHNGEINTVRGNQNWMRAREAMFDTALFPEIDKILPVIAPGGSDSADFDHALEMLAMTGRSLPHAIMMMIPEPWSGHETMNEDKRGFYEFHASMMEPWDGPASIAFTDGETCGAVMDRNGLRTSRYYVTKDGLVIMASEVGVLPVDESNIAYKGRLQPGKMFLVDINEGRIISDEEIKAKISTQKPYKKWVEENQVNLKDLPALDFKFKLELDTLLQKQTAFGYTAEDIKIVIAPMIGTGQEATGSMGNDTPLAVLSEKPQLLFHYFKQLFAQVTNPAIDSLRENEVMSLKTRFGNLGNILDFENLTKDNIYVLESPILSNSQFEKFTVFFKDSLKVLDCTFDVQTNLKKRLDQLCSEAEIAVREGCKHLILSDKKISEKKAAIPMILAFGAINSKLVNLGIRGFASINVQTGEVLDTHSFAVLLGIGATIINPYLVFDSIYQRYEKKLFGKFNYEECIQRYIKSVDNGLLKIMSKMGISVLSSYRGGCNFEAVGLSRAIISEYFPGMISRISGIGIFGIETKVKALHKKAFQKNVSILPIGGIYKYRKNGEDHQYQGQLIHMLQHAVTINSYETYKKYAQGIYDLPRINLRDLLAFKKLARKVNIGEVESVDSLRKRFGSGSMSHGALSAEAHETLAIAMNRIGAASCSGEGGEDPKRFVKMKNGDSANSKVKQIASARFGVTVEYLNNCNEIEIKIAQGAKPGEGGQLPGFKVSKEIAKLRYSTPGVTLISPPPHHDIYSIEDLAQLIYDLKQTNPKARVGVKLVASTGVGTIAAGVAKAKADVILISGHSGGTGASPQTSIKHVGIPWEMGLTEANQILTLNGLRHQVTLRTDGGIKTGRDVVTAAMMGAEEFGIGTTSLVAMGCIMVRQCHSNTCPVGVCTQDLNLRNKFTGTPEKVVNLFTFIAQEVREILTELGFKNLNEIIGRTDLLKQVSIGTSNLDDLDLNPLLVQADPGKNKRYCESNLINKVPPTLDEKIYEDIKNSITQKNKIKSSYKIKNTHRAVGTRLSHYIFKKFGNKGIEENTVEINLEGSAGQSLGAFGIRGLKLNVIGDANDYVGKGLSGATIVIKPPIESNLVSSENTIIGNTVLYGATSGKLFAAGQSGERFAVRNSGAEAVIEGCDSNGCEYMTGGSVVILGKIGDNFAAGMTGGMAFIYDPDQEFENYVNSSSVTWQIPETDYWKDYLKKLIDEHYKVTQSKIAYKILKNYNDEVGNFKQACPKEMLDKLSNPLSLKTKISKAV